MLVVIGGSSVAAADSFGGFSAVDRVYRVGADRVCGPLPVDSGRAAGVPKCDKRDADVLAQLAFKDGVVQAGGKARFAASASGKTLTVTGPDGGPVVTWDAGDPIDKVAGVWASQYEDRVAVAYVVRRLGREQTDVVAFELVKTTQASGSGTGSGTAAVGPGSTSVGTPAVASTAAPVDPKVADAVAAAKKAPRAKVLAAWQAVLALDAHHAEALYRVASEQAGAKRTADAIASLQALAASGRDEAVEWLVDARFDGAFSGMRADPKFRAAVGLDRAAATPYERLMGLGGQWEQSGTSCDKPEVHLRVMRDHAFKLQVRTVCEGSILDTPFKGTWRIDGDMIVLTVPTGGRQATAKDDAPCRFERTGDEDSLRCSLGRDLEFVVLPTRR
jgi:hypothetical protein